VRRTTGSGDDVLVGILPRAADLTILLDRLWYRVPVGKAPTRGWPPKWFAAFEPRKVSGGAQAIRYFSRVRSIDEIAAEDLFPGLPTGQRAGRRYHRLNLAAIQELDEPIVATRNRRNPFIATTWPKFSRAKTFNDLFNESLLEGILWGGLKQLRIDDAIERQFECLTKRNRRYYLDFAVFCAGSNIDVEADGDGYHLREPDVKYDKERDRELAESGWSVLRFPPEELLHLDSCIEQIAETIAANGGVEESGVVPRILPPRSRHAQPRLF
jgi:very-short-patch-repair endonuclease